MKLTKSIFGQLSSGENVEAFLLENENGMSVNLISLGAIITSIKSPNKNGQSGETVLGFNDLESYIKPHPHFGAVVGRVANRISNAAFVLEGHKYTLVKNNGDHHLHGGHNGFDKQNWHCMTFQNEQSISVIMEHTSPDSTENYPGTLFCSIVFTLHQYNQLDIEYIARSDKTTILNLSHHEYFNLKDGGQTPAYDHLLKIHSSQYTPCDKDVCPTGEIKSVINSALDFKEWKTIQSQILKLDGAIEAGKGFDNNYILDKDTHLSLVAEVKEMTSGRCLNVYSTKRCVQFYTAGHLDGTLHRDEHKFFAYHGFCLIFQAIFYQPIRFIIIKRFISFRFCKI